MPDKPRKTAAKRNGQITRTGPFVKPARAAVMIDGSTKTLIRYEEMGLLTPYWLGGQRRYRMADVMALVSRERPESIQQQANNLTALARKAQREKRTTANR